jgi:hypothetical protein
MYLGREMYREAHSLSSLHLLSNDRMHRHVVSMWASALENAREFEQVSIAVIFVFALGILLKIDTDNVKHCFFAEQAACCYLSAEMITAAIGALSASSHPLSLLYAHKLSLGHFNSFPVAQVSKIAVALHRLNNHQSAMQVVLDHIQARARATQPGKVIVTQTERDTFSLNALVGLALNLKAFEALTTITAARTPGPIARDLQPIREMAERINGALGSVELENIPVTAIFCNQRFDIFCFSFLCFP